jgi:hypothetical protein
MGVLHRMWCVTSLTRGGNRKYVLRLLLRFGVLLYLWKLLICSTCYVPSVTLRLPAMALLIAMLKGARISVIISVTCFVHTITCIQVNKTIRNITHVSVRILYFNCKTNHILNRDLGSKTWCNKPTVCYAQWFSVNLCTSWIVPWRFYIVEQ